MVVDGELISASGQDFVAAHAHLPLLTGVARREWAHKKRMPMRMDVVNLSSAQFYNFRKFDNLTRNESLESVRRVIDVAFHGTTDSWMPNSTLELVTNATYLRYIDNADGRSELPFIVRRLQDVQLELSSPIRELVTVGGGYRICGAMSTRD
jgi:hypothetical protein